MVEYLSLGYSIVSGVFKFFTKDWWPIWSSAFYDEFYQFNIIYNSLDSIVYSYWTSEDPKGSLLSS